MKKHFVVFLCPGTFFSEKEEKEISSWGVEEAVKMSKSISQIYAAKPYGFYFETRSRNNKDLDSKTTKTSCMYYLGGKVETLKEIKDKHRKEDEILISNMETNGYARVITNTNSWKITLPLEEDDVVLDYIC